MAACYNRCDRETGGKEAVIKFDSEAAASTACLLNNALIDGDNVKVELFPFPEERPSSTSRTASPPVSESAATNDSFISIFSGLAATSRAFASDVAKKVQTFDEQYGVSEKVVAGATTAWTESKRLAQEIDARYQVKDSVASVLQSTKQQVASVATSVNEKISQTISTSPRPQSSSPASQSQSGL